MKGHSPEDIRSCPKGWEAVVTPHPSTRLQMKILLLYSLPHPPAPEQCLAAWAGLGEPWLNSRMLKDPLCTPNQQPQCFAWRRHAKNCAD